MAQRWRAGRPDTNTDGDTVGSANNTPADRAVPAVVEVPVSAGGDAVNTDTLADAQLMAITFAKMAAHNGQRTLAKRLVSIANELDWELHQAAEQPPTKEGE